MTQEEKELLLKDLYARLPYGVKILHEGWNYEWDQELSTLEKVTGIDEKFIYVKVINEHTGEEYMSDKHCINILSIKPFLRPMSSITEEEKYKLLKFGAITCLENGEVVDVSCVGFERHADIQDYLNACHLDYRGLIPKGLALEAKEGMYKNK